MAPADPEVVSYPIANDVDLVLRIIEYYPIVADGKGIGKSPESQSAEPDPKQEKIKKIHNYRVNRACLASKSQQLIEALVNQKADPTQLNIEHPRSVQIWLKLLHDHDITATAKLSADFTIADVYHMLTTAQKFNLDTQMEEAKGWFHCWWAAFNEGSPSYEDYLAVLLPCYAFDHAIGFAVTTLYLVYHTPGCEILPKSPPGYNGPPLKLDLRISRALNAAVGGLKKKTYHVVYSRLQTLAKSPVVPENSMLVHMFLQGLLQSKVLPVPWTIDTDSIWDVIEKLRSYTNPERARPFGASSDQNFPSLMRSAAEQILAYFEGLCLDCMSQSDPELPGQSLEAYWKYNIGGTKKTTCRVPHGQTTWYSSFMGSHRLEVKWRGEISEMPKPFASRREAK